MKQKRSKRVFSGNPFKTYVSKFRNRYGFTLKELEKKLDVSTTKIYEWHYTGKLKDMLKNKT